MALQRRLGAPAEEPAVEPVEFESEAEFRVRLGSILRGYGYGVYHHDPDADQRFSVKGARGYVDLYALVPGAVPWRKEIPVLGIECKLAKNLGWLRSADPQIRKYAEDVTTAEYRIGARVVPSPTLFLVCTQDSWYQGELYLWRPDWIRRVGPEAQATGWHMLTELYDRMIHPHGSILLGGSEPPRFFSNVSGGPIRRYEVAP